MLSTLLPERADNSYRGLKIALWLLGILVLLRVVMSVNSIFSGHDVAMKADGIPLDMYPAAAAQSIVGLFGVIGIANLTICILCVIVLVRYRALVPLMFVMVLLQHLAGRLRDVLMPIPRTSGAPATYVNLTLLGLMLAGLALSLVHRRETTRA